MEADHQGSICPVRDPARVCSSHPRQTKVHVPLNSFDQQHNSAESTPVAPRRSVGSGYPSTPGSTNNNEIVRTRIPNLPSTQRLGETTPVGMGRTMCEQAVPRTPVVPEREHSGSDGHGPTRRLDGQDRRQIGLLSRSRAPSKSETARVPGQQPNLHPSLSPIRDELVPICLVPDHRDSNLLSPKGIRDSDYLLCGRHVTCPPRPTDSQSTNPTGAPIIHETRRTRFLRQIGVDTDKTNDLPRLRPRYGQVANLPSTREGRESKTTHEKSLERTTDWGMHCSSPSQHHRDADILPSSDPGSTPKNPPRSSIAEHYVRGVEELPSKGTPTFARGGNCVVSPAPSIPIIVAGPQGTHCPPVQPNFFVFRRLRHRLGSSPVASGRSMGVSQRGLDTRKNAPHQREGGHCVETGGRAVDPPADPKNVCSLDRFDGSPCTLTEDTSSPQTISSPTRSSNPINVGQSSDSNGSDLVGIRDQQTRRCPIESGTRPQGTPYPTKTGIRPTKGILVRGRHIPPAIPFDDPESIEGSHHQQQRSQTNSTYDDTDDDTDDDGDTESSDDDDDIEWEGVIDPRNRPSFLPTSTEGKNKRSSLQSTITRKRKRCPTNTIRSSSSSSSYPGSRVADSLLDAGVVERSGSGSPLSRLGGNEVFGRGALASLVDSAYAEQTKQQRRRDVQLFETMPGTNDREKALSLVAYGFSIRKWAGATVRRALSNVAKVNLTVRRVLATDDVFKDLLRACKKARPAQRRYGRGPSDVYDPGLLVRYVAALNPADLRLRALVAVRVGSGIRSSDAARIRRSSIREEDLLSGERVVVFRYRSKSAEANGLEDPLGYIHFAEANAQVPCLASWLLEYAKTQPLGLPTDPERDFLFSWSSDHTRPLNPVSVASSVKDAMVASGIPARFGAHSLRFAIVTKALASGVPLDEIVTRFGWMNSETARRHYAACVKPTNLSKIIFSRGVGNDSSQ